jgi:hypothetical protein
MNEHIDPVNIPGLPPMNRHTYTDDEGNPLPDVRYSYRQERRRRSILPWLSITIGVLVVGMVVAVLA